MDLQQLSALIDLCRSRGVTALECEGVKLTLGPVAVSPAPVVMPPRQERTPVQEIEDLESKLLGNRRLPGELTAKQVA